MSGFSRFYPDFTAGQLRYLAGGADSILDDQYLLCNGATVSQATYSDLYALIGLIKNGNWDTTWTARTSGTASNINSLIYNGSSLFVYGGVGGVLATSTNAITWTAQTSGTISSIEALTYGSSLYVMAGAGGMLRTSTDAITWTARTSGTSSNILSLAYGNGLYLYGALGGALRTSSDGITWTVRASGTTSAIRALLYASNLYVYAGDNSALATSTDAITWTARSAGFGLSEIYALAYGNGLYLAGGTEGKLATSTDAITWVQRTTGLPTNASGTIDAIIVTEDYFIFTAGGDYIGYSTDGITWSIGLNIATSVTSLAYKTNNLLVGAGSNGVVRTANFYAYDPATQFALPTAGVTASLKYPITPVVYIKYR